MRANGDQIRASLREHVRIWNGALSNPEWFERFDFVEVGCGELISLTHPETVLDEHRALLDAGAEALSTNTLGATAAVMAAENGSGHLVVEVNAESARLARLAADERSTPAHPRWVLGSIGPTLHPVSIMGGGEERFAIIRQDYIVQARALWQGGVDLLHVEACQDARNARAALEAIAVLEAELGYRIPVMVTAGIEATGTMLCGTTAADFLAAIGIFDPLVFGVSGWRAPLNESLRSLPINPSIPLAALAQVFTPAYEQGWLETPNSLADRLAPIAATGAVSILGVAGCPRPAYVRALIDAVR